MLNTIAQLKLTALASAAGNYAPYELTEDEKITVKAFSGSTLAREFFIGKVAPTFRHTYVLLAGDPDVYHAQGAFRNTFYTTVEDLRDKHVLTFDRAAIETVEIQKGDLAVTATRTAVASEQNTPPEDTSGQTPQTAASPKTQWQTANGDILNQKVLDELLNTLSNLQCDGYIEDKSEADFTSPLWSLSFKDTAQTYTLSVFAKQNEDDPNQPAISSTSPYVFKPAG